MSVKKAKKPEGVTAEPVYNLTAEEKSFLKEMETPEGRLRVVECISTLKRSVQTWEVDATHKERRIERMREQREELERELRRERNEYQHLKRNAEVVLTQARGLHQVISGMENSLALSFRRVDADGEENTAYIHMESKAYGE